MNWINKLVKGFNFEKNTNVYEKLGVHQFKKIVPFGDSWIKLYNSICGKKISLIRSKSHAVIWLIFTLSVEFLHFTALLILMFFIVKSAIDKNYISFFKLTGINILVNLYPIMVQRYNRIRLFKIFKLTKGDLTKFQVEF